MINFLPWRQQQIKQKKRQWLLLITISLAINLLFCFYYYFHIERINKLLSTKLKTNHTLQYKLLNNYQSYCHDKKQQRQLTLLLNTLIKKKEQQKKIVAQLKIIPAIVNNKAGLNTITLHNDVFIATLTLQQKQINRLIKSVGETRYIIKKNSVRNNEINISLQRKKQ